MTAGTRPTAPYVPAKTRPFRFGTTSAGVEDEDDAPLAIGALIDGRYEITGLVGEGGMGRVYAAEHRFLSRRVALKMLHKDAQTSAENVQRFRQEALLTTRIGHPGIVEVLDCATLPDGRIYMVMELLDGESLEEAMERPGPADLRLGWLAEIATAVAAAHRVGVIHRDIKPANLFLATGADGQTIPKILDFGIAKAKGEAGVQTKAGALLGTPYYLAPERALSRPLDARADLYSLGVILYEMLTGDVPFVGETMMEVVGHHIHSPPLDPRQAAPSRPIPAKLAEFTLSLLAKDPELRPADGDLVAASLRAILEDEQEALAALVLGPPEPMSPLAAESGAATVPPLSAADSSTQRLDLPVSASADPGTVRPLRPLRPLQTARPVRPVRPIMTSFADLPAGASPAPATVLNAPDLPAPDLPAPEDQGRGLAGSGRRRTGLVVLILAAGGLLVFAALRSSSAPDPVNPGDRRKGDTPSLTTEEMPAQPTPPPAADVGAAATTAAATTAAQTAAQTAAATTAAQTAAQTAHDEPGSSTAEAPSAEVNKPSAAKTTTKKPASTKTTTTTKKPATKQPSPGDGPTIKTDIYDEG